MKPALLLAGMVAMAATLGSIGDPPEPLAPPAEPAPPPSPPAETPVADDPERRAWQITKGTSVSVVFDNRHGRRALESLTARVRRRKGRRR